MDNKQLLKQLSQSSAGGKAGQTSALSRMMAKLKGIPGLEAAQKAVKNTKPKQMVDLAVFTVGTYLMYQFGKIVADTIDNQMPTEKSMMEMMRGMSGPAGMPPPPM